ncbi:MAG: hypothetical protein KBD42_14150 [Chitinophagales bacterium]|nr:hypothetical protein [Chitinophagales bacterium]MBP9797185.1 hypothetical protein [Chitinophagales bacterium]
MQNTQLQEVLQKFMKKDLKTFSDYLRSPYFTKKITLLSFWEEIKEFAPDFEISELQKQQICEKISGKIFSDSYYRNLCSDMLEIVINYLAEEEFHNAPHDIAQFRNEALLKAGLFNLLEKNIKQTDLLIDKSQLPHPKKLYQKIRIDDYTINLHIRRNRNKHENITKLMLDVDRPKKIMDYALGKSLLHILNHIRASKIVKEKFDYSFVEHYLYIYEKGLTSNDSFVNAYYLATKIAITGNEEFYFKLKEILFEDDQSLPANDSANLFVVLIDFVFPRGETGERKWLNEMFEIYDFRLNKNFWKLHADFAYTSLLNIIQTSLILGKIQYAEEVIEKYGPLISASVRSHIINLCNAWISFYKGEAEAAHQYLIPIESENIVIKYSLRTLQAMIYFEKGEFQVLHSYIDSFKHFINYNSETIEGVIKTSGLTFCNLMNLMIKLKLDPDQKNADKLRKEILESEFLMKEWFLKQV